MLYLWIMGPRRCYFMNYDIVMIEREYMIIVKVYETHVYMWSQSVFFYLIKCDHDTL